jgi:hypothetical protein
MSLDRVIEKVGERSHSQPEKYVKPTANPDLYPTAYGLVSLP